MLELNYTYIYCAFAAYAISQAITAYLRSLRLRAIPSVGSDSALLSYTNAFRFAGNARSMIEEGYKKVRTIRVFSLMVSI